ncbi:MAG: VPLPA-CTERM sorting domain-containing protein [Pseudomonadota bacterium]
MARLLGILIFNLLLCSNALATTMTLIGTSANPSAVSDFTITFVDGSNGGALDGLLEFSEITNFTGPTLISTSTLATSIQVVPDIPTIALLSGPQSNVITNWLFAHGTGSFSWSGTYQVTAVPIPAAAWLFISAIGGMFGLKRYRRGRAA